jgi:hypothetical protein
MSSTNKMRKPNDPQKPQPEGGNRKKIYFAFFLCLLLLPFFIRKNSWLDLHVHALALINPRQDPLAADLTGDPCG